MADGAQLLTWGFPLGGFGRVQVEIIVS